MRVLYRQFLFRVVDLELIAPQGDLTRLLGQIASVLAFGSVLLTMRALGLDGTRMARPELLAAAWPVEQAAISATMLVVGLFSVLSWDSLFPDRRDVMVLGPLPIPSRNIFLAKTAAVASALGAAIGTLNALPGIAIPLALAPRSSNLLDLILSPQNYRVFAAWWLTSAAAGLFVFGGVVTLQGLTAAMLPHRLFLRASAWLQLAAFSLFVAGYFVEPAIRPGQPGSPAWPSHWFVGLFQQISGTPHPALDGLAPRAWAAIATALSGAAAAYLLSFFRTMRRMVEQPDIAAGSRRTPLVRLERFVPPLTLFALRTVLRSRQHRVMLAFYVGIAGAIVLLILRTGLGRQQQALSPGGQLALMFASLVAATAWIFGLRVVFAMPYALPANWIFRLSRVLPDRAYLPAIRRIPLHLGVLPVCGLGALLFLLWDVRLAAAHLAVLGLWSLLLTSLALRGFHKIPFTCSYLPGKTPVHMAVLAAIGLLNLTLHGVRFELALIRAGGRPLAILFGGLATAVLAAWWWMRAGAEPETDGTWVAFEEEYDPAVHTLGLIRDGVMPRPAP